MSVLDGLEDVVDCFRIPGGIEVERRSVTGVDADGDPTSGPLQRFTIDPAVVQPAPPRELLRLPEGDRATETILVHTKRKLRTSLEARGLGADVVKHRPGGDKETMRYVVRVAGDWKIIGGFFACLAVREELD